MDWTRNDTWPEYSYDNRAKYFLFPSCGLNRSTKQQYLKPTSGSIHPYPNWLCSKSTMRYYSDTQWMNEWMHDQFLILSWQNPLLIPFIDLINHFRFFFCPLIPLRMTAMHSICPWNQQPLLFVLLSGTISLTCINYNYVLRTPYWIHGEIACPDESGKSSVDLLIRDYDRLWCIGHIRLTLLSRYLGFDDRIFQCLDRL